MAERDSVAARRCENAASLWRLADQAREEARQHRERARELDVEAERLDRAAAAVQDGRPLSEALT